MARRKTLLVEAQEIDLGESCYGDSGQYRDAILMHVRGAYLLRGALGTTFWAFCVSLSVGAPPLIYDLGGPSQLTLARTWHGQASEYEWAVKRATLEGDGAIRLETNRGVITGRYAKEDADNARLELESAAPWTKITLLNRDTLVIANDDDSRAQRLVSERRKWRQTAEALFYVLPFVGAVAGILLLAGGSGAVPRMIAGSCAATIPGGFLIILTFISIQGGGEPDYVWGAIGCGTGWAVIGGVGLGMAGCGSALAGALLFGVAGAVWGYAGFWYAVHAAPQWVQVSAALAPFTVAGMLAGVYAAGSSEF